MSSIQSTLIATLGSEAQVITLALDCLLEIDKHVERVIVVHTTPDDGPVKQALDRVTAEFAAGHYAPTIEFATRALHDRGTPLKDVDEQGGARAAFGEIFRIVRDEKKAGRRIHLSVAGGRKTMSVFGMAVAQMLFDENDRLWHLVSYGRLLAEKRMHAAAADEVALIEIPVLQWSAVSPVMTDVMKIDVLWVDNLN